MKMRVERHELRTVFAIPGAKTMNCHTFIQKRVKNEDEVAILNRNFYIDNAYQPVCHYQNVINDKK